MLDGSSIRSNMCFIHTMSIWCCMLLWYLYTCRTFCKNIKGELAIMIGGPLLLQNAGQQKGYEKDHANPYHLSYWFGPDVPPT
eukprot:UN06921